MSLNHVFGDVGRKWNFENYLFVSVWSEIIPKWFLLSPQFIFFSLSVIKLKNSIIPPTLEGQKKTVEAKAIEYCSLKLDTISASVTKFQCRQVSLEKQLMHFSLFGSLALDTSCFAEVLGTYGCNSAQWELCFQNGMWCCIIMSVLQDKFFPILYWCIVS